MYIPYEFLDYCKNENAMLNRPYMYSRSVCACQKFLNSNYHM